MAPNHRGGWLPGQRYPSHGYYTETQVLSNTKGTAPWRNLTDRNLLFKELDQGQPLSAGQSPLVDPPSRKLVEGIGTTRATVSLIGQFVQLMALATGSIPFMVFKAFSQQIFSSLALTASKIIISV